MGQLNFGHRLGLFKRCWGFSVNQELADFLCFGSSSADLERRERRLTFQTVHRWITNPRGTSGSVYSEPDLCINFVKYASQERNGHTSLIDIYGMSAVELRETLLDADDQRFVEFLVRHSRPLSPLRLAGGAAPADQRIPIPSDFHGRFLLYRLGVQSRRVLGKAVPGEVRRVLRRIPVEFVKDQDRLVYKERYKDGSFHTQSEGSVFRTREYINILGQDSGEDNYSEWFFYLIVSRPEDGLFLGLVAMDGDMGIPSAYRVVLRPASIPGDSELDWASYCEKYNHAYPITEQHDLLPRRDPETGADLHAILNQLSLESVKNGLYE